MAKRILVPLYRKIDLDVFFHIIMPVLSEKDEITLFHVIQVPITTAMDRELFSKELEEANKWLEEMAKELMDKGLNVRTRVVMSRDIAEAIAREGEEENHDVIFMLKRRRKSLKRIFQRSISSKVSELSRKPVITLLVDKI
jgi:nucleotide-binding universal stress UspA family protein